MTTTLAKVAGSVAAAAGPAPHLREDLLTPRFYTTEIAKAANVKALVFNHIVPPLPLSGLEQNFAKGARHIYQGQLQVGKDGDWFTLLSGSTAVEMGKRP